MQNMLPDLKDWWDDLNDVCSKVLQMVARRVSDNLDRLKTKKDNGRKVGMLEWKPPREYRSLTYNQSGFELKNTSDQTVLSLSKVGEVPIHLHRDIPDNAHVKQVTVKQDKTGEWYAILGIETEDDVPETPALDEVDREDMVGIDVGVIKYAHDTDSTMVGSLDLESEFERLEREQRVSSRKQEGSQNWHKQRRRLACIHTRIVRKRRDFLHKLSTYYAREYDLVAVEDLNVHGMMQLPSNSRNRASASWRTFMDYEITHTDDPGVHLVTEKADGTSHYHVTLERHPEGNTKTRWNYIGSDRNK